VSHLKDVLYVCWVLGVCIAMLWLIVWMVELGII
jgi:hypothetical protein